MIYNKNMSDSLTRTTIYTEGVQTALAKLGHATNAELTEALRVSYPNLSVTTVHRVTARLLSLGIIGSAPVALDGSARFDTTLTAHDHFMCSHCGQLRDITLSAAVYKHIRKSSEGCDITGPLAIQGNCHKCIS